MKSPEDVMPRMIEARAARDKRATFIEHTDGRTLSYDAAHRLALDWARALLRLGVGSGDRVAVLLPTRLDGLSIWLGIAWAGAIEVPINTDYKGAMLEHVLNDSGARVIVTDRLLYARLADVAERLDQLQRVIVVDVEDDDDSVTQSPFATSAASQVLCATGEDPDASLTAPGLDDLAGIFYTSGTTGASKGVMVTWAQLHEMSLGCFPQGVLNATDAWYVHYPPYHVSARLPLIQMATVGGRLVLRERFRTQVFWDDVRRTRCTATLLMGAQQAFLAGVPEAADDADNPLAYVLMAPLPASLDTFSSRFGIRVCTVYNMTETSSPIASPAFELPNTRTCGKVRAGHHARVVGERDQPLGPNEVGELVLRSDIPSVMMAGYWGAPEATVAAWRDLWFHTGDAAMYDEDGWFYFVDRRKDAIRRRGENVSSREVEAEVNGHPQVLESAAVGVPADVGEEEIKVFVVPHPGERLDPRRLVEYLIPRMPRFMVPRYVEICSDLPRTPTMKIKKADLRAAGVTEATWDREAAGVVIPR